MDGSGTVDVVALLHAQINRFLQDDDREGVLGVEAMLLAHRSLREAAADPLLGPGALQRLQKVAWWRLFRDEALGGSAEEGELGIRLFVVLRAVAPDLVPASEQGITDRLLNALAGTPARRDLELGEHLLRASYERADLDTLDVSVACFRRGLAKVDDGYDTAAAWHNLALALVARRAITRSPVDLVEAVDACRAAVRAAGDHHRELGMFLQNLGVLLSDLFELTGQIADLREGVEAKQRAVAVDPTDEDQGDRVYNLGADYLTLYRHEGRPDNLDRSVDLAREALRHGPTIGARWSLLCTALTQRYERTSVGADIVEAVAAGAEATRLCGDDHPNHGRFLHNHSIAVHALYRRTGDSLRLHEALVLARAAVASTSDGDPELGGRLSQAALCLADRFRLHDDPHDLDDAVVLHRRAMDVTSAGVAHDRYRSNLAAALRHRYQIFGDRHDLNAAIELGEQDTSNLDEVDMPQALRLAALCTTLLTRYQVHGRQTDITRAIDVGRVALAAIAGHPDEAFAAAALAHALCIRGDGPSQADLEEAIPLARRALDLTPPGAPRHGARLWGLAGVTFRRFLRGHDPHDLDRAGTLLRKAVDVLPAGADRAEALSLLGDVEIYAGGRPAVQTAYRYWREAIATATASDSARMVAVLRWDSAAERYGSAADRAEALACAVDIIKAAAQRGTTRRSKENQLHTWGWVSTEAPAGAIATGDPHAAIALLERARAVLWTQQLRLETDDARLRTTHPGIAAQFDHLRRALTGLDHDEYTIS